MYFIIYNDKFIRKYKIDRIISYLTYHQEGGANK